MSEGELRSRIGDEVAEFVEAAKIHYENARRRKGRLASISEVPREMYIDRVVLGTGWLSTRVAFPLAQRVADARCCLFGHDASGSMEMPCSRLCRLPGMDDHIQFPDELLDEIRAQVGDEAEERYEHFMSTGIGRFYCELENEIDALARHPEQSDLFRPGLRLATSRRKLARNLRRRQLRYEQEFDAVMTDYDRRNHG